MNLRKIIREEMDEFDWIRTTETINIGGIKGIPADTAKLGDKVKVRMGYAFTIEEIDPEDNWVWGSDLGRHAYVAGVKSYGKNWHNPGYLVKISDDLQESGNFDWIRDIEPYTYNNLKGKALEFNPPITDINYITHVLDELVLMGFTSHINPIYAAESGVVGIYLYSHRDRHGSEYRTIYTRDNMEESSYQEHINYFADKPVDVLDGYEVFPLK